MTDVTVAEAKNRLPALLRAVEAGGSVRITRRGRAVGILLSEAEYERLVRAAEQTRPTLGEAIASYRNEAHLDWDLVPEEVDGWRDRSTGRGEPWPE